MKKIRNIILIILIFFAAVLWLNKETDLLSDFTAHAPGFSERYPVVAERITGLSESLSKLTDPIPSFAQLMAIVRNEEPPIDPDDIAHNAYIEHSPLLSFYPKETIGITVSEDRTAVSLYGIVSGRDKTHLIAQFNTADGIELSKTAFAADNENTFAKEIKMPETEADRIELAVYAGGKAYGDFKSWVMHYLYLIRDEASGWRIEQSPVYEHNRGMYEKNKSHSEALKSTVNIPAEHLSVQSAAEQLTAGCTDDYERLVRLHDWVCSYLYYDEDSLSRGEQVPYVATEVLARRRAVCLGYANLLAALARSLDIPCNVVSGYGLGVGEDLKWTQDTVQTDEANHAWVEAYADGRWILIDPTWDSLNRYADGTFIKGDSVSHLYFDANLEFFSGNHKIIEYLKR